MMARRLMGRGGGGIWEWPGIVFGPDGKLYCAPRDATNILIIDPVAGTATRSNMGADLSGSAKYIGIAVGPDGKLYCAPHDANDILTITTSAMSNFSRRIYLDHRMQTL